jgi:hypothetical protein
VWLSEQEVIDALIKHLEKQSDSWKFFYGRESFDAKTMIKKLQHDRSFRKTVLTMVNNLSVDILLRQPK